MENTAMTCCSKDLTVDQLLADPLTQVVMKADQVDRHELAIMLRARAHDLAADQTARENSIVGRLIGRHLDRFMAGLMGALSAYYGAAYYGAALCGCLQSGASFQTCRAS
jgi:hypothetical protein